MMQFLSMLVNMELTQTKYGLEKVGAIVITSLLSGFRSIFLLLS